MLPLPSPLLLLLLLQSLQSIVQSVEHGPEPLRIDAVALSVLAIAVLAKLGLALWCWRLRDNPSIAALVQVGVGR